MRKRKQFAERLAWNEDWLYFDVPALLKARFSESCESVGLAPTKVLLFSMKHFLRENKAGASARVLPEPNEGVLLRSRLKLTKEFKAFFVDACVTRHRPVSGQICAFMRDYVSKHGGFGESRQV